MPITLDTDIAHINQVGQKTAEKLAKLEVFTVKDLLFYYPFRYQDFSQVTAIDQLEPGVPATIFGRIEILKNRRSWQKKMIITEGLVSDESGSIKVIWFNQQYISKNLKPGDQIYLAGTISNDGQLISPVYERAKSDGSTIHTARLVPIYSVTSGLTQKQVRWLISIALKLVDQLVEWLPSDLMAELNLWSVQKSLAQIHFPDSDKNLEQAVRRLKFDELFMFLLQIQMIKKDSKLFSAPKIDFFETETKDFVNQLPFKLTDDQKKSAWQIIKDLANPHPMNRLLEGDVG
ncbi:MAG: DNA helicase RecG, partial [Candidatus Buchananbacteria bacterium]|nr:DNA helicase RecG [Candidatus Buchananbacteria bacterium]